MNSTKAQIKKIKKNTIFKNSKNSLTKSEPKRSKELPVYQGQVEEFRSEVNAKFTSVNQEFKALRKEIDARFNQVDARFNQVDARFNQVDARFDKMEAKFNKMDGQFSEVLASIHRVQMIVEEQNNRNKYVLDGFANLHADLEAHKKQNHDRINDLEALIKLNTK